MPLRIAHRGMPRLATENTLRSFALALDAGADGLELDVHATRDGVVVVHHDPALPDGTVIAASAAADVLDREITPGVRVPTLVELCDMVCGRAELFVEVKGEGIESLVLAALHEYEGGYAIHSFDHALIARMHALAPALRLGVLFEDRAPDLPALLGRTGARDVWPHAPLVTPALVTQAHAMGARVIPWTINTSVEAQRLAALGVDALCGDDVRMLE
ncbi:MAG TPA: glycerophosphodiester phosphodiesterase [Gemmatimonadaceae bacterium]|nr:glycerophosphodiester phosphodiesterase [Gemmatimonadaceae bacterium]